MKQEKFSSLEFFKDLALGENELFLLKGGTTPIGVGTGCHCGCSPNSIPGVGTGCNCDCGTTAPPTPGPTDGPTDTPVTSII